MSLLFETIRFCDGVPQHAGWHERRMNRSRLETRPGADMLHIGEVFKVPPEFGHGEARCNIVYDSEIREITFSRYEKRSIRSLKLVPCDTIDYHLKFSDRRRLETLLSLRGNCDDIIIVKNGLLTDTSFSNILLFDGVRWITPATPLLPGTCRERLLSEGKITEGEITPEELERFSGVKLINALREPSEEMMIPISQIFR
ncbi:MAG: aminotransferase class IV [Bacteroidota bacterium]